jgi:hypothetical protein
MVDISELLGRPLIDETIQMSIVYNYFYLRLFFVNSVITVLYFNFNIYLIDSDN